MDSTLAKQFGISKSPTAPVAAGGPPNNENDHENGPIPAVPGGGQPMPAVGGAPGPVDAADGNVALCERKRSAGTEAGAGIRAVGVVAESPAISPQPQTMLRDVYPEDIRGQAKEDGTWETSEDELESMPDEDRISPTGENFTRCLLDYRATMLRGTEEAASSSDSRYFTPIEIVPKARRMDIMCGAQCEIKNTKINQFVACEIQTCLLRQMTGEETTVGTMIEELRFHLHRRGCRFLRFETIGSQCTWVVTNDSLIISKELVKRFAIERRKLQRSYRIHHLKHQISLLEKFEKAEERLWGFDPSNDNTPPSPPGDDRKQPPPSPLNDNRQRAPPPPPPPRDDRQRATPPPPSQPQFVFHNTFNINQVPIVHDDASFPSVYNNNTTASFQNYLVPATNNTAGDQNVVPPVITALQNFAPSIHNTAAFQNSVSQAQFVSPPTQNEMTAFLSRLQAGTNQWNGNN